MGCPPQVPALQALLWGRGWARRPWIWPGDWSADAWTLVGVVAMVTVGVVMGRVAPAQPPDATAPPQRPAVPGLLTGQSLCCQPVVGGRGREGKPQGWLEGAWGSDGHPQAGMGPGLIQEQLFLADLGQEAPEDRPSETPHQCLGIGTDSSPRPKWAGDPTAPKARTSECFV